MRKKHLFICLVGLFSSVTCPYPPMGDEVLPGSVLLPATRRGRYLANIVRRQAVDGTGIKFNKDADRMNAEAKKKVDVLSDDLLPYIISEQERRVTLYKRVMTAIQNGEKGVTIAEIRNKPPLIIRKGLMYRCPSNRVPKEPDGSGIIMCEDNVEPTQVMYDSCLSAEDRDLYQANNNYFFCNRHRIEGPDLPRNGSTVIGCAPIERTPLNYTSSKCALEDTDDVVVHYRYYPDRTYKYVSEMDSDREVCDHWNPCQIGYIFSLPSIDQALPANELWHDYAERQASEIVPQDDNEEYVHQSVQNYKSSPRKVILPPGFQFEKVRAKRNLDKGAWDVQAKLTEIEVTEDDKSVTITLHFPEVFEDDFYSTYYAQLSKKNRKSSPKLVKFLTIYPSTAVVQPKELSLIHGKSNTTTEIPFKCNRCRLQAIMLRTPCGSVHNLDASKYRVKETVDKRGRVKQVIEIMTQDLKPQDFGDFFAIVANAENTEERIKIVTVQDIRNEIKVSCLMMSLENGAHFDTTAQYACDDCKLNDVLCNDASAVDSGRVAVVAATKTVTFNFPRYENANSCAYVGIFENKGTYYRKTLAVIDMVRTPAVAKVKPPKVGTEFEFSVAFTCEESCMIEKVTCNGIELEQGELNKGGAGGAYGYFVVNNNVLTIRIAEFTDIFEGAYQAQFIVAGETITKSVLDINSCSGKKGKAGGGVKEMRHTEGDTTEAGSAAETTSSEGSKVTSTDNPSQGDNSTNDNEGGAAAGGGAK